MAGKRKKEKSQDRKFWGVLWIETADYNTEDVLKTIQEYFEEWAFILHDKDVYTLEDEKKNPENKAGTPKKKHIHSIDNSNPDYPVYCFKPWSTERYYRSKGF